MTQPQSQRGWCTSRGEPFNIAVPTPCNLSPIGLISTRSPTANFSSFYNAADTRIECTGSMNLFAKPRPYLGKTPWLNFGTPRDAPARRHGSWDLTPKAKPIFRWAEWVGMRRQPTASQWVRTFLRSTIGIRPQD